MTLALSKVSEQVEEMSEALATRANQRQKVLPAVRELLRLYANDQERLAALAKLPGGQERDCALPTHEPLNAVFPASEPPEPATVLAVDGSQIYADLHSQVLYYLINIGSLVYHHGSGRAPVATSEPVVACAVDRAGGLVSVEQVNARRDVSEIRRLADLAEAGSGGDPLVALLDSTLGLRAWSPDIPRAEQEALQRSYAAQIERTRLAGAALAGVISRSRRAGVVNLLDLAWQEDPSCTSPGPSALMGIGDRELWGDLRPGERSALFVNAGTPPIYFFYLNANPLDWPRPPGIEAEPARVEVPEWVALNPEKLSWIHTLVYDQSQISNGYPYALTRADELAIILHAEREALETMILRGIGRQGMSTPQLSHKAAQKRVARAPFRRRL